jgi:hypothetical protein
MFFLCSQRKVAEKLIGSVVLVGMKWSGWTAGLTGKTRQAIAGKRKKTNNFLLKVNNTPTTRMTRLGEFSPIGRLSSLGRF